MVDNQDWPELKESRVPDPALIKGQMTLPGTKQPSQCESYTDVALLKC